MEKILFVDDCKDPQMYLGRGVVVPWAKNGADAIDMWREGDFDTLYLDNDMGGGPQGYKVLEAIIEIRMPKKVYSVTNNIVAQERFQLICHMFNIKFEVAMTDSDKRRWGLA